MKETFIDTQNDNLPDYFKGVSRKQWDDWRWQRDNSLRIYHNDLLSQKQKILKKISEAVSLPTEDVNSLEKVLKNWDVLITPHQILQIRRKLAEGDKESSLALFKTVNPSISEGEKYQQIVKLKIDGLGVGYRRKEKYNTPENPQPREIRRLYDDRVVITCTWQCPTGCRYCFRRPEALIGPEKVDWQKSLDYIKKWNLTHPKEEQVKDVILSGGDPLSLADDQIEAIVQRVKSIQGVKFLRIDTKYLAAMPQRITPELAEILGEYVDLMCFHFTHSVELSPETKKAALRLKKQGIILRSYTPLLKGINNERKILEELFTNLLYDCGISPYYLVQLVETPGVNHFKVPLEKALELQKAMQTEISGPAIPQFVVYLPEGGKYIFGVDREPIKRIPQGWLFPDSFHQREKVLYPEPIPKNKQFKPSTL